MRYRILLLICLVLPACGGDNQPTAESERTVVLVTVDSLRASRLSLYDGPVVMPALDRLAEQGTVFEDMSTVVPQSRPAVATILTGQLPMEHGVRNDVSDRLDRNARTLPAIFNDAGFTTAAFVTSGINSWTSGFQHAFDLFDGPDEFTVGPGVYAPSVRPSSDALDHLETWMKGSLATGSSFAWIHLADLQDAATDAPPGEALQSYDEALAELDGNLGRLLDFLESWAVETGPVDIILTGTYGVHLEDDKFHGARGSSYWLDEATLQVPAIIARLGEGGSPAVRDRSPCWLPDLYVTLHNIATGKVGSTEHGTDRVRYAWTWAPNDELLWPVLTAENTGSGWEPFSGAGKYVGQGRGYRLSDEMRKAIRDTGIRLGDSTDPSPAMEGEDRAAFLAQLFMVRHNFGNGRERRVPRSTKRMIDARPDNLATLYNRGTFLLMAGASEPAEELFDVMLDRYPDVPEVLHWAAHLELARQQQDRAFALLQGALSLGWSDGDLLYDLACVHALKGERQPALDSLKEAIDAGYRNWDWIDQDPDLVSLRADPEYGRLMSAKGR